MSDLRDPLDDLLADIPSYVAADAGAAWSAGARRRVRQRIGVAAVMAVLIVLVAGVLNVLPRSSQIPPAGEPGSSPGYPSHVQKPWVLRDLPDRPGPVSAVVERPDGTWLAAAPDGRAWLIPQGDPIDSFPPALSDDGRMIGYLAGTSGFVLRDLVTGEQTQFDSITDNATRRSRPDKWWVTSQAPSFWSPDGTKLLFNGGKWSDDSPVRGVVLGVDGSLVTIPGAAHGPYGSPVGWLDDDTLAWVDGNDLVAVDLAGQVESRHPLEITQKDLNQWSGALSGDRTELALVQSRGNGAIATFSTADGKMTGRERVGAREWCSPTWAGDEPAFFQDGAIIAPSGQRTLVVDPAIDTGCVLVAGDALAGPRHEGLADRLFQETWLTWRWQEATLCLLAAIGVVGLALLTNRRRRRHHLG